MRIAINTDTRLCRNIPVVLILHHKVSIILEEHLFHFLTDCLMLFPFRSGYLQTISD